MAQASRKIEQEIANKMARAIKPTYQELAVGLQDLLLANYDMRTGERLEADNHDDDLAFKDAFGKARRLVELANMEVFVGDAVAEVAEEEPEEFDSDYLDRLWDALRWRNSERIEEAIERGHSAEMHKLLAASEINTAVGKVMFEYERAGIETPERIKTLFGKWQGERK